MRIYVIKVDGCDDRLFGPYWEDAVDSVGREIRKHLNRRDLIDSAQREITAIPVADWTGEEFPIKPLEPECPACAVKIKVWTCALTGKTVGECTNPRCTEYENRLDIDVFENRFFIKS